MKLRNYTSTVPSMRSIAEIEQKLVRFGARNIAKRYDQKGRLEALIFDLPDGDVLRPVLLPARVDRIFEAFSKAAKRNRYGRSEKLYEQAERTGWKLMLEWIDIQMALITLNQAEPLEVFMPYMFNGKRTLYEMARDNNFKMLAAPAEGKP